jgi:hypothetical protein
MTAAHFTRRAALLGLAGLGAGCGLNEPATRASGPLIGVAYSLSNGGQAWLSRFDLADTIIDHIAQVSQTLNPKAGDYYPRSKSPAFTRLDAPTVLTNYRAQHSSGAKALINCSFFERYDAETELSFPIKQGGRITTGGSSPYGPRSNPADPRYAKVVLKALVWNGQGIMMTDFDHLTGGVLHDARFADGLVTYDYKDHPANVLAGDPVGRYQLLGVSAPRSDGLSASLFVLTIAKGRMVDGAALLASMGAVGSILTVDGGPSTHLWSGGEANKITTESVSLPHYLGFRLRA